MDKKKVKEQLDNLFPDMPNTKSDLRDMFLELMLYHIDPEEIDEQPLPLHSFKFDDDFEFKNGQKFAIETADHVFVWLVQKTIKIKKRTRGQYRNLFCNNLDLEHDWEK